MPHSGITYTGMRYNYNKFYNISYFFNTTKTIFYTQFLFGNVKNCVYFYVLVILKK
jgi:hypothetical protein